MDMATKNCPVTTFGLAKRYTRRIIAPTLLGEAGAFATGAEGSTAPETLRQKDQQGADGTLERCAHRSARRRDNNLRQRDRGGSKDKAQPRLNI
jgi:hypothetical protein